MAKMLDAIFLIQNRTKAFSGLPNIFTFTMEFSKGDTNLLEGYCFFIEEYCNFSTRKPPLSVRSCSIK